MSEQPSGGLMQALAPIAVRRPVHVIITGGEAEGALHVVCQPLRVSDRDPALLRALVDVGVDVGRTLRVTDAAAVAIDGGEAVPLPDGAAGAVWLTA